MKYTIYTDGSCYPNPGPGGFGVVILKESARKELSGSFHNTTNNRMEMAGPICALDLFEDEIEADIYSDSQYVVNAFVKGWAAKWKENGWKKKDYETGRMEEIPNKDLWERLWNLNWKHDIIWHWVKGHVGIKENERCDELARLGRLFATDENNDFKESVKITEYGEEGMIWL